MDTCNLILFDHFCYKRMGAWMLWSSLFQYLFVSVNERLFFAELWTVFFMFANTTISKISYAG